MTSMKQDSTEEDILWSRRLPVRYRADVVVIGGGIAGVCAACSAAREGTSVILVERFAVTGGNATVGGVGNWSGDTRGQGAIFDEIIAMQEVWNAVAPYPGPYEHFSSSANRIFDHEILAVILQELLNRYGVRSLLHTRFIDACVLKNRISEVIVCGQSGPEVLRANMFIDCSGEAQLASAAGFTTMKGRKEDGLQLPASLMFFIRETGETATAQLPQGWFEPVRHADDLPMTSIWPNGPGGKALKIKVPGFDSTDTQSMSALESRARQRMFEVLDYYQRVEGRPWHFDYASLIVGLREGRRVLGDYVLSVDDLRAGREFDDAIARGVFYLDGMTPDDEKRTYLLAKQDQIVPPYQIPLRTLIAKDGVNLFMAGRCFSTDQLALSSARVMTTCAMMGQAAGLAAALCVKNKCSATNLNPADVRRLIEQYGACLGRKR